MRVKNEMDDDEKGKLFVGGLSWETTQENLQRYFSRYGEVIDCVVMKNSESGRSRGFGFVTFSDPSNVGVVLQNGPHQLDGRTIDPKPCNPRTLQKPKRTGGFPKVFLGGLPSNVTETDLRGFFSRFGKVMEVVIMYDQEKKKSRGFGFLSFEDEDAVDRCVSEHFVNLNGKQVEIKRAEPRDSSSKMNDSHPGQWGPPQQGPPMGMAGNMGPMGGPNGQMGGPMMGGPMGPPGNMMQQYQGWGTSPQTGGYASYSAQYNAQGWGAPPGPPQQQQIPPPPPHQWGSSYNVQPAAANQAYGSYGGPTAAASGGYGPAAGTGGAAGGGPGATWNSWNMPQNGPPPGHSSQPPPQPLQPNSSQNSNSNPSGPLGDIYSRQTTGSGAPGSSSSSAKTPDYAGYTGYSNYGDTSYPQRSYGGGESSQGLGDGSGPSNVPRQQTGSGNLQLVRCGSAERDFESAQIGIVVSQPRNVVGPQRVQPVNSNTYHPYRRS
ncbi:heterogeneous nuclear ribonucleoprotein 27C isoform X3 [Trichogramma pretiosum]|uniref:heterogeneous nuclear ribonucleoprotein 27C isoform X3 n=1 Tax=Trichogramma pretiosum TaxID=7493 RepID=UPI0006C98390|nr:heterogeneous nuclear ribonucleoprotein 27C isoform X3 [Trichogramma pretiosum]